MSDVIPVHRYRIRYYTERDGVRQIHDVAVCSTSTKSAILRATRDHANQLFGPDRRGRVISVVREGNN